jgi:hypothetical protein
MIKELPQSTKNTLAFEVTGNVTLEEEKAWITRLDKIVEKEDKISVMVILGENASWGTWAGIEDIKWLFKNYKKFKKVAIVAQSSVWKWLVAIDSQFAKLVGVDEKYFEPHKHKEAWEWVNA